MADTTAFDLVAWLYEQGRWTPHQTIQERDWCDKINCAALEIERLREVVWLYIDEINVKPSYKPIIARCAQ